MTVWIDTIRDNESGVCAPAIGNPPEKGDPLSQPENTPPYEVRVNPPLTLAEILAGDPRACACINTSRCPDCMRSFFLTRYRLQSRDERDLLHGALERTHRAAQLAEEEREELARYMRETRRQQKRYISPRRRMDILRRDNFRCGYCGRTAEDHKVTLHVDHQQPLSKGGSNEDVNLWTLCDECNLAKSNKLL